MRSESHPTGIRVPAEGLQVMRNRDEVEKWSKFGSRRKERYRCCHPAVKAEKAG